MKKDDQKSKLPDINDFIKETCEYCDNVKVRLSQVENWSEVKEISVEAKKEFLKNAVMFAAYAFAYMAVRQMIMAAYMLQFSAIMTETALACFEIEKSGI